MLIRTVRSPTASDYSWNILNHGLDFAPSLIIWAFDSRGTACFRSGCGSVRINYLLGGVSEGANSTALPDWVDSSVATWIEQQTALMDSVWGPADDSRGALAFVHIPP